MPIKHVITKFLGHDQRQLIRIEEALLKTETGKNKTRICAKNFVDVIRKAHSAFASCFRSGISPLSNQSSFPFEGNFKLRRDSHTSINHYTGHGQ